MDTAADLTATDPIAAESTTTGPTATDLTDASRVPFEPAPVDRVTAAHRVADAAARAAERAGHACVVERSPGSESTYLHVCRGGVWFGLRVSCHRPAYACSADYEQLPMRAPVDDEEVDRLSELAAERVLVGGLVVADPARVGEAIGRVGAVLADGRLYRGSDGARWRWSSADATWRLAGPYWGQGAPTPPTHRPDPLLSARIRSQVRHAQNVAARWASEQEADEAERAGG